LIKYGSACSETSKQLIAETRVPIPMKPGRPALVEYEYERNGTANLFMLFAPLEGWRYIKVTDRHTAIDYAHVLKDLADSHFPHKATIVLVQDNLNIHSKASLYEAFPPTEARRLVERFEWHYTPKHGSWLDLAESELGVLSAQCLDRRIPDKQAPYRRRARSPGHPRQHDRVLSLSIIGGQVAVSWDRRPTGPAATLMLEWRERGPPVGSKNQSSYGTDLIRNLIPHAERLRPLSASVNSG
jgi:DDE superfamily endonuclease